MPPAIIKPAALATPEAVRTRFQVLGLDLDLMPEVPALGDPLGQPLTVAGAGLPGRTIGNRFAILPMEGWDGGEDGSVTDLVRRRWRNFGISGAKLIWGGEAVAVRRDGRANPRQLVINADTVGGLADLRRELVEAHVFHHGRSDDQVIGLQLTHSGRFSRPNERTKPEPAIAYRHPLLDRRVGVSDDQAVVSDAWLDDLVGDVVEAAVRAQGAGFDFVDLKLCHGYLGHELLSAVHRPGVYGGSILNRTRFLRSCIAGIRQDAPGLAIGVRLSLFDQLPFRAGADGIGEPEPWTGPYPFAFGANPDAPDEITWDEPLALLRMLESMEVRLVCLTAGSPYYNPHLQRPAAVPPSDGYRTPEDPLVGVARQLAAVRRAKAEVPGLTIIGSAYSYLQEWLTAVARHEVATGGVDVVGLGRSVLSYPGYVADVLAGRDVQRRKICRTFSDCTTGPRNGLVSGCFPLDDFYKTHPDRECLKALAKT